MQDEYMISGLIGSFNISHPVIEAKNGDNNPINDMNVAVNLFSKYPYKL